MSMGSGTKLLIMQGCAGAGTYVILLPCGVISSRIKDSPACRQMKDTVCRAFQTTVEMLETPIQGKHRPRRKGKDYMPQ